MAQINKPGSLVAERTHEGAPAKRIDAEQRLRRSIMSCLLWEKEFYEDGQSIANRIKELVAVVEPYAVADMAIHAREKMKLRHIPLFLMRELSRRKIKSSLISETLARVIQRPDELSEFLAIYWKDGKEKLAAQVKKGLAMAFPKFDAYSLAKYNRDGAVKLRDVLFLCHAKPKDKAQEKVWKKLVDGTLESPDTWEVELSASKNKKASWERLLKEKKLFALAFLRNLRNMHEAGVDERLVVSGFDDMKTDRVLPFRFIAAARHAPQWEPQIEGAMMRCLEGSEKLPGKTVLLVDVSGSMDEILSSKSEMIRMDAAFGLAILLRELAADVSIYTFSDNLVRIPIRHGFALRDAMKNSQPHSGTYLGKALKAVQEDYDRIIVITDEQSHDPVPNPKAKGYLINVASAKNGVGYGAWTHIDGWSEAVIDYIRLVENQ